MSNLLGESSLKSVESGFANFKTGSDGKKDGAVKEQASAISETNWKFVLVGKVTKRGEVELPDGSYDKLEKLETTVGNRTSSLKSNQSGFTNFETRAVCIKNHAALEPFKEQASAKSETNWVFDLIVKLKKIEEQIHKELLSEYHNKLEKLKEFIRVLEKLEHELKAEHKENEKLWKGLESEFSSVMTLCDQLNENLEHLHDAATEDERLLFDNVLYDTNSSDTSSFEIMLNRELKVFDMVHYLFSALEKLDDLCSRLVSSEKTVGNSDKGLQKLDIENEKVDYNENKVPSRTFRGKRMSTPIEDKGDKGLQKLDIENVKVDYNENKVPSRTFKGKRMSTPIEDKDINMIDIKSCDVLAQQLELARTSQNPVVMLFYAKCFRTCRNSYLPKFDDLPNQYRHLDGDIKFFTVRVKRAATEFKVKAYPTVLVLMPGSCGLQVVGRLSIEETIIIPAFVKALKTLLDKCLKGVLPV